MTSAILFDLVRLTSSQLAIVASVARALKVPVEATIGEHSDVVSEAFSETMSNLLTLHHALHEEPLSKKSFEYLFKQCLMASDHPAHINPRPGDSAWDVEGGGVKWSLKTEAAKGISIHSIKIEKFMEARWVREAVSPEKCSNAVQEWLPRHMQHYDRILVLRVFAAHDSYLYVLEEIPVSLLLDRFSSVGPSIFFKKGRSISYGADFYDDQGSKIFRILLDSSVEKVRLWFQSAYAIRHGTWSIRVGEVQKTQQASMVN